MRPALPLLAALACLLTLAGCGSSHTKPSPSAHAATTTGGGTTGASDDAADPYDPDTDGGSPGFGAAMAADGSGNVAPTRPSDARPLVAFLGDSITAGAPTYDPDPAVRLAIGNALDPDHSFEHWFALEHPGLRVRNCGVNRQRTDEVAARMDACAAGAEVLVLQAGINDLAQGRGVAYAADGLEAMVEHAKQLEVAHVVLVDVVPWNAGYPRFAPMIDELDTRIRSLGQRHGIQVLQFYNTLVDPAAPGRMRADWTIDGSHPSTAGHRRLGEIALAPVAEFVANADVAPKP